MLTKDLTEDCVVVVSARQPSSLHKLQATRRSHVSRLQETVSGVMKTHRRRKRKLDAFLVLKSDVDSWFSVTG